MEADNSSLSVWQKEYLSTLNSCINEGTRILDLLKADKESDKKYDIDYYTKLQALLKSFRKTGDDTIALVEKQADHDPVKDVLDKTKKVLEELQSELKIVELKVWNLSLDMVTKNLAEFISANQGEENNVPK